MKTLIAVCVLGLGVAACDEHMKNKNKAHEDAVDRTQTTSALIVDPTLHDSHAAQPVDQTPAPSSDMDVDENIAGPTDELESRDGG